MYKAIFQSKRVVAVLALSIAAPLLLVNASAESLTAVNSSTPKKDSEFPQLVTLVLKTGKNGEIKKNIAPVIGLDKATPIKIQENKLSDKSTTREFRSCSVVLPEVTEKQPKCIYLAWVKKSAGKMETQYYRVSLNGHLEKSVTTISEFDKEDKPVRGSGKKVDNDINSPETKKAFDAEMAYWLKDWLKKEQQAASTKKQAAVAQPATAAAL